jgi:hypothetical protein
LSHQICIFLDGLDEVRQSDGKHKLLNLLDWFKSSAPLKLCVSSRPEEEFNQALSSASILELHNLTAPDMYRYARDLLAPLTRNFSGSVPSLEAYSRAFRKKYDTNTPQTLAKIIVSKSDGIFLWADIATRSLQRGITYGDTWSTIQQRLEQMPPGLSELYAAMWSRPGEDTRLYRAEAALCFNLVLDWELCSPDNYYTCWNPKHFSGPRYFAYDANHFCRRIYPVPSQPSQAFTLFHLALAKQKVLSADLIFETESNTDLLWNECFRVYKRLPILSAGLLETTDPLSSVDDVGHEIRSPHIPVVFIHRTAKEFFTDTVEGREILEADTSSFQKRLSALCRASYSRGLAFRSSGALERELFCLPLAKVGTHIITEKFHDLRTRLERKEWLEELDACQAFHDGNIRLVGSKHDFLGLAIQCGHKEYLEYVFHDPYKYTPTYKNYLLVCGTRPRMTPRTMTPPFTKFAGYNRDSSLQPLSWTRQVLTRWLEIVNYLLSQGCKSEPTIFVNEIERYGVYKLTGLEAFLWSWPTLHRRISLNDDPVPFDLIIETLQHFSESGADFMQHVYGYYGREGLCAGSYPWSETPIHFGPGCQGEQRTFGSFRQVVVEWSILGALTYAVKTLHRDDYFRRRLEEFSVR